MRLDVGTTGLGLDMAERMSKSMYPEVDAFWVDFALAALGSKQRSSWRALSSARMGLPLGAAPVLFARA